MSLFNNNDYTPVVWKKPKVEEKKQVPNRPTTTFRNLDSDDPDAPKSISYSFKKAMQQARIAKKLSQVELAKAVNVHHSFIANLEAGKTYPTPDILVKINRALGTKLKKDM